MKTVQTAMYHNTWRDAGVRAIFLWNFMHLTGLCQLLFNWIACQARDIREPSEPRHAADGQPTGQLIPHKQLWKTDLYPINSANWNTFPIPSANHFQQWDYNTIYSNFFIIPYKLPHGDHSWEKRNRVDTCMSKIWRELKPVFSQRIRS